MDNKEDKPKKTYKDYYQSFKLKHADKVDNAIRCPICGGSYTYYAKSKHLRTKKHNSQNGQKGSLIN